MSRSDIGLVYVVTNPAMPDIVKIGFTSSMDVTKRVAELSASTAVPLPFEALASIPVERPREVELRIHAALENYRVSPSREFFRLSECAALHCAAEVLWPLEYQPGPTFGPGCADEMCAASYIRAWMKHVDRMARLYPDHFRNTELCGFILEAVRRYEREFGPI